MDSNKENITLINKEATIKNVLNHYLNKMNIQKFNELMNESDWESSLIDICESSDIQIVYS